MVKQWGRSAAYLLVAGFSAPVSMPLLMLIPMSGFSLIVAGLGFVLFPVAVMIIRLWTDVHRQLVSWVLDAPVPRAFRPLTGGVLARVRQVLTDEMTWRDLVWLVAHLVYGFALGMMSLLLMAFAFGSTAAVLFWWALPGSDSVHISGAHIDSWGKDLAVGLPVAVLSVTMAWFGIPF